MRIPFNPALTRKRLKRWGIPTHIHKYFKNAGLKKEGKLLRVHPEGYSHPIYLRRCTSDIAIFRQIICEEEYKYDLKRDPRTILDCGANVGLTAVYWANRYPQARIISVEPEDSNFEILLLNTAGYSNVTAVKGGIWSRPADLVIDNLLDDTDNVAFIVREAREGEKNGLKAYSIPGLIEKFRVGHIDLIKLDIEGSEKVVFENAPHSWMSRVSNMAVELHDRITPGCSKALFAALGAYEFEMNIIGENLLFEFKHTI